MGIRGTVRDGKSFNDAARGSTIRTLHRNIYIYTRGISRSARLEFAVYAIISSSVAVYGIGPYRSRQTVTLAGLFVGLTGAFLAVALIAYTQQPFILNTVLLAVSCGLGSGIITAALTAMFLPLCESLFGILTDVKLLELSNADLPVLGQLAMRAPGTNQHSHAVGTVGRRSLSRGRR
jgi:membrane-associated HD superfamily phosphohydrolase